MVARSPLAEQSDRYLLLRGQNTLLPTMARWRKRRRGDTRVNLKPAGGC